MRSARVCVAVAILVIIYAASFSAPLILPAQSQQGPLQYALEGLTRSPSVGMTSGSLGGWNEDDWVPFRLTITNPEGNEQVTEAAVNLEYQNQGRIGIDAFAACFSDSAADCGSGRTPTLGPSAVGNGSLWQLLVDSSIQTPTVSFSSEPGGVETIQWRLSSLSVGAQGSVSIMWSVHLAKGNSTNLACLEKSPLAPCSPETVPPGMGEASWPGRSLQVRAAEPIPGQRTVSIDVAQQPAASGCIVATAAYGSELAVPVQFLRSFRDDDVQRTYLGARFLDAFNAWYYSWSPAVARAEIHDKQLATALRFFITPLIGALVLTRPIFHTLVGFNPELAILASGLSASALIGIVYLAPIYLLASRFKGKLLTRKSLSYLIIVGAAFALIGTLPNGITSLSEILPAVLVIQTMLVSPALVVRIVEWLTRPNRI